MLFTFGFNVAAPSRVDGFNSNLFQFFLFFGHGLIEKKKRERERKSGKKKKKGRKGKYLKIRISRSSVTSF